MVRRVILLMAMGIATPAATQIGLPPVGQTVESISGALGGMVDDLTGLDIRSPVQSASELARNRIARLTAFARAHRDAIELDDNRQPARKGVVLLLDAGPAAIGRARQMGFAATFVEDLDNLELSVAELSVPDGMNLDRALRILRPALPDKTITADQIHFRSGAVDVPRGNGKTSSLPPIATKVGLIDGGVASVVKTVDAKGFAKGGITPSDHGTAIASLMRHAGVTRIVSADVYGQDPAGGNALAIVRALDWMTGQKVSVISISLVGPRNPLLERAVAAARRNEAVLVAAVGNDGPAAPPAYPASYKQVVAVTGVDNRNRALIEAGRALHLDYAAPGADMKALDRQGNSRSVRGTSFAAPLAAARIAAALDRGVGRDALRAAIDAEARDLGKKGHDKVFGRGLLCGGCRPR